LFFQDNY